LLGAVLIFACGAARGADPPRIEGWEPAQRKFMAWQGEMLRRRAEPTEEMKRIFYHKTTVPPPSPPAQEGMWRKIKYPMRFDYSIFDPMGLLPAMPDLRVGLGDPTVRVSFKVQAGLLNLRMLNHDITLFAVGPGSEEAFGDAKTVMKTGLLGVPLSRYGLKGEAALTSQLTAHGLEPTGAVAELGGSYGLVSGAVKVGLDPNAPVIGASVDVGPQLVPEQYSDVAQVKIAVGGEFSMPAVIEDIQWKSKHGLSQVASRAAVKITRMIRGPTDCPYCKHLGEVTCRQCSNRRTITCPDCAGKRKVQCDRCGGGGRISCSTTQSCSPCRGTGRLSCSGCGGTGRITVRRRYTRQETRSYRVPVTAGFDSNGDPIVRYRTHYKTVNVPYWETESHLCSACNGTGYGPTCSACSGTGRVTCRRCGGRGWYTCRPCGGTGKVNCRRCEGAGRITCPNCRGREITCPLCKGAKEIGVGR
ncbi:MAG: hypothetical protein WBF17_25345, partial [Phycisphaerae bacterium]